MKKKKNYQDYDKEVLDIEELDINNITINPSYYIHLSLQELKTTLTNPNSQEGFLQYRIHVEHLEVIAEAAGILSNSYKEDLKEYIKSEEYKNQPEDMKEIKLSIKKLRFILQYVFKNQTNTTPLKYKPQTHT